MWTQRGRTVVVDATRQTPIASCPLTSSKKTMAYRGTLATSRVKVDQQVSCIYQIVKALFMADEDGLKAAPMQVIISGGGDGARASGAIAVEVTNESCTIRPCM